MSANPIAGMGGGAEGNHVASNLGRGGRGGGLLWEEGLICC